MSKISSERALALALDGKLASVDRETATLMAVVDALRALPEPEIDQNWALALEQRILADGLEEAPVPVGPPALTVVSFPEAPADDVIRTMDNVIAMPRRRVLVRKSVAAIAACFMLGAFPVMAASKALPGSPFYGLKQDLFSAKLAVFGDAAQDAHWRLEHAAGHIREAEVLSGLGSDRSLVDQALGLAAYEFAKAEQTIRTVTDTEALRAFARDAATTEALLQKSAPSFGPESGDAFDQVVQAASSLTASVIATIGELSGTSVEAVVETIGTTVNGVADSGHAATPSSAEASAGGTVKTGDKRPGTGDKSSTGGNTGGNGNVDGGGDDNGTGKALRGVEDTGCSLPASYEIGMLTGMTAELCMESRIS